MKAQEFEVAKPKPKSQSVVKTAAKKLPVLQEKDVIAPNRSQADEQAHPQFDDDFHQAHTPHLRHIDSMLFHKIKHWD